VKIELHLLQNFAPSNLNRDDTGAPKDCEFGGYRRARISSQCQKRAVRQAFEMEQLIDEEHRGARTKRLAHRVADVLRDEHGCDQREAMELATGAIDGVGLGRNKKGSGDDLSKTEYLLFVPRRIVRDIALVLNTHRDILGPADSGENKEAGGKKPSSRDAKKAAQSAYPKKVKDEVEALLESARSAVDVALFGRMIADKPDWNVDAACQVAQAFSTNRVQMDFDFFTAVDDFKPRDTAGSDMMGTVQFNSSCFYRYAVLDVDSLRTNLDGDETLLQRAVHAFLQAFVSAIPTGKQNSMAAHNPPSYVLAVVRATGQPLSLANAFLKPARPRGDDVDLIDDSIEKLESYVDRLRDLLGKADSLSWADRDVKTSETSPRRIGSLSELYTKTTGMVMGAPS
jgi:CRISPR system Cascade subunit CasC